MDYTMKKISKNIISLTQSDSDSDGSKWVESKKLLARKIFYQDQAKVIVVVSKSGLTDILSDQVSSFRDSIKYSNDLSITSLKFDNIDYYITLMENVPEEIIDDLVNSQEFIWGNLWLFRINKTEWNLNDNLINEIRCVLSKSTFLETPNISSELLASTSDGCELLWFNPSSNEV
ncbi:unnamed protein product [Adineta steineri]|uniref:Uncharacterized protein n=1 Tax=Adineta steineri TaxID=433720 RepID=A0A814F5R1_9BILA|nr:unnamed protein product [Adineta steineri]CAF0975401.1 unnamed protein product [Adineta steineri]